MSTRGPSELEGDVVLNSVRYVLGADRQRGRAWWESNARPDQEGNINVPLFQTWDRGWFGGMGEILRVSDTSNGNAFTINMDTTNYGFARPCGAQTTVTPDSPPVDKPMFGFEDGPSSGTYSPTTGNFVKEASGGDDIQTITVPANTKAMYFFTVGDPDTGDVEAGAPVCVGITDFTTSRSAGWNSEDAAADSNCSRFWSTGAIVLPTATGTATPPIATVTYDSATTVTVTWANNDASVPIIHYKIWSGADIQASVDAWTLPTSATTKAVTGVGFQPQFCMHISAGTTAVGSEASARHSFGMMDENGNQWAVFGRSADALTTSSTSSGLEAGAAIELLATTGGAIEHLVSMVSMDADGFTVDDSVGTAANMVGTLSIRGLRVAVGYVAKNTGAATVSQGAVTLPFTSTSYLLGSALGLTSTGAGSGNFLTLGAAGSTTTEQTVSWVDEHNVATMGVHAVSDTAASFEKLTISAGTPTEAAVGVAASVDMNQANWLSLTTNDAVATIIGYVAFAPLDDDSIGASTFIHIGNGQRITKISGTTTLTVESQKDFGVAAQVGRMAKFGATPKWYIPLGDTTTSQTLDTIASSGADTYAALGSIKSLAYAVTIEGAAQKLNRAHTGNLVDVSTDGSTFGADFTGCQKAETITSMIDSGTDLFVFTNANAWHLVGGLSRRVTRFSPNDKSPNYGAGSMVPSGSAVFLYNHRDIYQSVDGGQALGVGPDSNPLNKDIEFETLTPVNLDITEVVYGSDNWVYAAGRTSFTQSGATTVVTYLLAGQRSPGATQVVWHSYARFTGIMRLVPIDGGLDSRQRLWFADISNGRFGFYKFGINGNPDPGRSGFVGFGAVSTTYELWLPETDFGLPSTLKQFRSVDVNATGLTAEIPLTVFRIMDTNASEGVFESASSTTDGVSSFFRTSNLSGYRIRYIIKLVASASYDPTVLYGDEPRILSLSASAIARTQYAREITMWISTDAPLSGSGKIEQTLTSTEIRSNLRALQNGAPISATDPDGTSRTLIVTDVNDLDVRITKGVPHYTIEVKAIAWNTTTTST